MALLTQSLTLGGAVGGYSPQGLYSFEFRDRESPSDSSEVFLLLPPEREQVYNGYRMQVHRTIDGSTTFDFMGADPPEITISGQLWSYWIDMLPAPFGNNLVPSLGDGVPNVISQGVNQFVSNSVNKAANSVAKAVSNVFPLNEMSGLEEFFRIKYMLYDFFLPTGKYTTPRSLKNLGRPLSGLSFLEEKAKANKNNLNALSIIYHNYDDDYHWEVVPTGQFQVERDKKDPFTARWTLRLKAVKDMRQSGFSVPLIDKRADADQAMNDIANALIALNPLLPFQRAGRVISDEFNELSRISNDEITRKYDEKVREYTERRSDNLDEVVYESQQNYETAETASSQYGQAVYGKTLSDIASDVDSNSPPKDALIMAVDPAYRGIGQYLQAMAEMSAMAAYKNGTNRIRKSDLQSVSVQSLPDLTDESFSNSSKLPESTYIDKAETWVIYKIKKGDTLGSIAARKLGNYGRFPEIARLNNLSLQSYNLDNLIGAKLKLPTLEKTQFNNNENRVYSDSNDVIENLLGRDIALTTNRDIQVDSSGDIDLLEPQETFQQNINDMSEVPVGSLVLYPDYGNNIEVGISGASVPKGVINSKVETMVRSDPRSDKVEPREARQDGDAIYYDYMIYSIADDVPAEVTI